MTKLSRRRFLSLSAAFAAAPQMGAAQTWSGRAFGAEVSLTLHGPRAETDGAIASMVTLLQQLEARFSLFDPASDLVRLNSFGRLVSPNPHMLALLRACDDAYHLTNGLFDPTIQPLWQALATGQDTSTALASIGWDHVHVAQDVVELAPGQALTLNGIAQGYATDVVTDQLQNSGWSDVLVNIGEHRGHGQPWRLSIADPLAGHMGHRTLVDGAMATSSPGAMHLAGSATHILHPQASPVWSTVSVEAERATLADAMSTALVFARKDEITTVLRKSPAIKRVTLIDNFGNLQTL